jgi:hypothetical protein
MTTDELIAYYSNLLILQYHDKPNAKAHVEAIARECIADQLISQVLNGFSIDTAIGKQLDIIGKYVGVPRVVNGFPFGRDYFGMPSYDDPSPGTYFGFYVYGDSPLTTFWAYYGDENNQYKMNDDEMRYIIKLKIAVNKSIHSLSEIDDTIEEFFEVSGTPVVAVVDNLDMTINYDFTPGAAEIKHKLAVYLNLMPHPAGVEPVITGL